MDTTHLHATCAAQPEELLAAQSAIKKRRGAADGLRGRKNTAPSIPPSPTYPHTRRRTVPPTLHPVFRIARINRREGQWSLSANKFTVARRTSDTHALDKLHEGSERGDSRDVCAVNVAAENVPSVAIYNLLLHARTADQLGEPCGLFGGNSLRGAIDPTAAHQDAAVHVADGLNPAGHGDSGATKTCGVIRGEAGAPLDRGRMDQYIRSRSDWKQRVVFRLAWMTASCWSDIVALTPNNFTLEADGSIVWIGPWRRGRRGRIPTAPFGP
ncbi:hypothetical protein TCDM_13323 [Trypanosoma cruzi Dm28c]|uniref:Uncharacterized protein n=1 Tax=Trypanosoma cruzi Dm28c TaxID=1416333 RepID=V5AIY4_TRYCR|nr:hypothetical protein TCDM_13323 [Trypanosoma cruzi Dm28c]